MMYNNGQQNIMLPVERLIKSAEIAKLDKNKNIQKVIMAIAATNDMQLAKDISETINLKAVYEHLQYFPFTTPSNEVFDKNLLRQKFLIIGKIKKTDKPFIYPLALFNQHGLVLGGTGTGKTNLLYGLILQSMKQEIPVCIFDKDKEDYRHLRRFRPDLLIFNAQKMPFNPLAPPTNVPIKYWLPVFVQVFSKSNSLLDGSESLLLRAMTELYRKFGVFNGNDTYPTVTDLNDKVRSYSFKGNRREAGFQDSILNRLGAYIALNKDVYEYSKGIPIEWLARQSFVLEVKGLTERIARFTMNIFLYALFLHRIASGQRGNNLKNLVVVDEAKWLAPPGFNEHLSFSPLTYVLAQAREVGIGMIIADQTAQLDDAVFVNSRLKVCFRLGSGVDMEKAQRTMALTKEQADYIPKLDTGECIVRIPREDPFVVETLRVNFR